MALSKEDILDGISALTVIELKELLDAFEERFGVTAAAPAAVAAFSTPIFPAKTMTSAMLAPVSFAIISGGPTPMQMTIPMVRPFQGGKGMV